MAIHRDLSEINVPPTIQALLASRLDPLAASERSVIEPASVVGYVFPEEAVTALAPPDVSRRVGDRAGDPRAEAPRPPRGGRGRRRAPLPSHHDPGHRVRRHPEARPGRPARRGSSRGPTWRTATAGVEFEEILGYHLEQAWSTSRELGPLDERGREIGEEGSRRLASAGRRAFARGDIPSAASLLGRAAAILPTNHPERLRLLPEHGEALLLTGRFDEASTVLDEAIDYRGTSPAAAARATLVQLLVALRTGPDGWDSGTVEQEISATVDVFEEAADDAGLAMAWRLLAWVGRHRMSLRRGCRGVSTRGRAREARGRRPPRASCDGGVRRLCGARPHARRRGDRPVRGRPSSRSATIGSRRGSSCPCWPPSTRCKASSTTRDLVAARGRTLFEELGLEMEKARLGMETSNIERLAGDLEAAVRELRSAYDALDAVGEKYVLSTFAGFLAQTLLEHGALEEASDYVRQEPRVDDRRGHRDAGPLALRPGTYPRPPGRLRGGRGDHARGSRRTSRRRRPSRTRSSATSRSARALAAAGRAKEAREAFEAARPLAETKGGVVILTGVLRHLEDLDAASATMSGLSHQLNGPLVRARATIVQIFGWPFGGVIETTQPSALVGSTEHNGSGVVVELWKTCVILSPLGSSASSATLNVNVTSVRRSPRARTCCRRSSSEAWRYTLRTAARSSREVLPSSVIVDATPPAAFAVNDTGRQKDVVTGFVFGSMRLVRAEAVGFAGAQPRARSRRRAGSVDGSSC